MNRLFSQHRKLVYMSGIIALLVPIIWLGMPSSGADGSGGKLAGLREQYGLGESDLGKVDPSSATMNLVLLGLRGVAANMLWLEMDKQKETKNWAQMRATTESIITLQPHYKKVWMFNAWNLAYNVSAEWDAVPDRYYWVKEGAKFTMQGRDRNKNFAELPWYEGIILGQKVGRSDEWRLFRKYFRKDPDEQRWQGKPDLDLNPNNIDNYLVAKDWFEIANEVDKDHPQERMMKPMFRRYPAQSRIDYAEVLEREGIFEEETRIGWEEAFRELTQKFGQEPFETPGGVIRLEATPEEIREMAKQQGRDANVLAYWQRRYRTMSNYNYWRTRALSEMEPETVEAHREIYEGKKLFREGKLRASKERLQSGMKKFAAVLERYPSLNHEDAPIEEGMTSVLYWVYIHQLLAETPPTEFPLKQLWIEHQNRRDEISEIFRRENSMQ
jgi:hypothetical protein